MGAAQRWFGGRGKAREIGYEYIDRDKGWGIHMKYNVMDKRRGMDK